MGGIELTAKRLADSEYVWSSPYHNFQVARGRILLFETVKDVYAEMLRKLSDKVFPLFEELVEAGYMFWGMNGPRFVSSYDLLTRTSMASSNGRTADTPVSVGKRGKLKSAFDGWAEAFNVTETWAKDEAARTLWYWHRDPESRKLLRWGVARMHVKQVPTPTGESFEFRCERWDTGVLTWSRYCKSVRQRFEKELRKYQKTTRQQMPFGLVRPQRQYSQVNFEWFVRYQFAGWSSTKIAEDYSSRHLRGLDESTVLKGVKSAAALTGWNKLRKRNNRKTS
jgi:hypothetical protein